MVLIGLACFVRRNPLSILSTCHTQNAQAVYPSGYFLLSAARRVITLQANAAPWAAPRVDFFAQK